MKNCISFFFCVCFFSVYVCVEMVDMHNHIAVHSPVSTTTHGTQRNAYECMRLHRGLEQTTRVTSEVYVSFLLNAYTTELKCKSLSRSLSCSLTRNRLRLAAWLSQNGMSTRPVLLD
jgi:hypothetical protein